MTAKDWLNDLCALKRWRPNMLAPMASAVAKEIPERFLSRSFTEQVSDNLDGVPTLAELIHVIRAMAPDTSANAGRMDENEAVAQAWIVGTRQRLAQNPALLDLRLSLARTHAPPEAYDAILHEHDRRQWERKQRYEREVASFKASKQALHMMHKFRNFGGERQP